MPQFITVSEYQYRFLVAILNPIRIFYADYAMRVGIVPVCGAMLTNEANPKPFQRLQYDQQVPQQSSGPTYLSKLSSTQLPPQTKYSQYQYCLITWSVN